MVKLSLAARKIILLQNSRPALAIKIGRPALADGLPRRSTRFYSSLFAFVSMRISKKKKKPPIISDWGLFLVGNHRRWVSCGFGYRGGKKNGPIIPRAIKRLAKNISAINLLCLSIHSSSRSANGGGFYAPAIS